MARAFHTIKGKTFGSNPLSRNFRIHSSEARAANLMNSKDAGSTPAGCKQNISCACGSVGRAANLMSSKVPGSSPGRRETTHGWLNW